MTVIAVTLFYLSTKPITKNSPLEITVEFEGRLEPGVSNKMFLK